MKKFLLIIVSIFVMIECGFNQISLVKDIVPGTESGLSETAVRGIYYQDHLIFPARTNDEGNELWVSDGTEAGTLLLKDINPGAASSDPGRFIIAFDKVYFVATTVSEGKELWVTDGTPEGTTIVMDIEPGTASSDPLLGAVFKDNLYFAATSSADRELWWMNALGQATLFYNINASAQSKPRAFTVLGDKMYFAANEHPIDLSANDEDEPYVTDGTVNGTVKLIDVTIDNHGAGVRDFVGLGSEVFFLASTNGGANPNDHEIFKTDGTPANTVLLQDLLGSQWLTPYSNYILFFYESALNRITSTGTFTTLSGIHNDVAYFASNRIVNFNNTLFIPAENSNGSTGVELYTSKATAATTGLLKDINQGAGSSNPQHLTVTEDKVVFSASSSDTNRELFETDGTPDGTKMVFDLNVGDAGSNPVALLLAGEVLYFYATTPETGFELYKYTLKPSSVLTIKEPFEGRIYPQPARDIVTIEWPSEKSWKTGQLTDPNGKLISVYNLENSNRTEIDLSKLPAGLYYFNLSNGSREAISTIVVQ